ncbi:MAG: endonuclease domain-containing protein, partial [Nitrospinota bacterium]
KLVIEVDGDSHFLDEKSRQDNERQIFIESQGIRFLRFTNTDIYQNMNEVLTSIEKYIEKYENHPSIPSLKRRGLLKG